jgi:hypothetical protein
MPANWKRKKRAGNNILLVWTKRKVGTIFDYAGPCDMEDLPGPVLGISVLPG